MVRKSFKDVIAQAIHAVDKRYFFEDYAKQAEEVYNALLLEGYTIIPEVPNEAMRKAGVQAITYGPTRPEDLVMAIYESMLDAWAGRKVK